MSTFIKAEKVVATALGLLERQVTLPAFVWRDAAGDFAGAKNDTISIRLPAYAVANTRPLRSGQARVKSSLHERKVDVTLDTDIYLDVPITDEELTLDIADFGAQVLNPVVGAIARGLEDNLHDTITNATYENTIAYVSSTDDPWQDVAVRAGEYLDNARVPVDGRVLLVGSRMHSEFLKSDKFVKANESGSTQTLRRGVVGEVNGFTVVKSLTLAADEAYAFHRTAYVLSQRAPIVPAGAPWGATQSFQGFAIRTVRVFDPNEVEDRFVADAWVGSNVVKDFGHYTADPDEGGQFVPAEDPDNPESGHTDDWANDAARLVRAVKITVS